MKYLFSFIFALVTALGVKAQTAATVSDTTLEHEVLLETTQVGCSKLASKTRPLFRLF